MKAQKLATVTLVYKDNPTVTLCPGHVGVDTFTLAHRNEGWTFDTIDGRELRYEYWVKLKTKWKKASPSAKGAKPVTVMDW